MHFIWIPFPFKQTALGDTAILNRKKTAAVVHNYGTADLFLTFTFGSKK